MMVNNDDWSRAAMKDDSILAEFLIQLKHGVKTKSQDVMITWGHRQPRSRSRLTASVSRCDRAFSTRCSPTTPLSWSGGASPSVTADGYEDSSRYHNHQAAARSKTTATSGYTSNSASTKRCRKKKSFAELKEEESSLIKEKIYLEREIATKNANFEVMRTTNESLKRMKLGFGSKSHNKPSSTSVELRGMVAGQPHQRIVSSEVHHTQDNTRPQSSESRPNRIQSTRESFFTIPDLNMMPSDDGMS